MLSVLTVAVGGLCVTGATTYYGFKKGKSFRDREQQIIQFRSALSALDTHLSFLKGNIYIVADKVSRHEPVKSFMEDFKSNMTIHEGRTGVEVYHVGDAWEKTVEQWKPILSLDDEDWEILLSMGHFIGVSDEELKTGFTKYITDQLNIQQDKAREDRKYERMWQYMGVCSGIILTILLI